MEPPVRSDSESVRDEKVKVLKAIPPLEANHGCALKQTNTRLALAWHHQAWLVREKEEILLKNTVGGLLWIALFDVVHHRGQLSTYIRPMGGKVPSIYGPSADEAG